MTGLVYRNAPQNVFHSWVEVFLDGKPFASIVIDRDRK